MRHSWIEHRRSPDRELLGWIRPEGEDFVAIDLLGRARTETVDWLSAEETLEELGIGYLDDVYEYRLDDGSWLRVRITEVSGDHICVKRDDWSSDAVGVPQHIFELPFPPSLDRFRAVGEKTH